MLQVYYTYPYIVFHPVLLSKLYVVCGLFEECEIDNKVQDLYIAISINHSKIFLH